MFVKLLEKYGVNHSKGLLAYHLHSMVKQRDQEHPRENSEHQLEGLVLKIRWCTMGL